MTKKTKRILLIALPIAAAVAVLAGILIYVFRPWTPSEGWQSINSIPDYEDLLDAPITEITLLNRTPYYYVSFSDEDLLQIWNDYFADLKVLPVRQYSVEERMQLLGYNPPQIILQTEGKEYQLIFNVQHDGTYFLEYSGYYFDFSEPAELPFEETYVIAMERHGEKCVWD